jgi:hypothetical protein
MLPPYEAPGNTPVTFSDWDQADRRLRPSPILSRVNRSVLSALVVFSIMLASHGTYPDRKKPTPLVMKLYPDRSGLSMGRWPMLVWVGPLAQTTQ